MDASRPTGAEQASGSGCRSAAEGRGRGGKKAAAEKAGREAGRGTSGGTKARAAGTGRGQRNVDHDHSEESARAAVQSRQQGRAERRRTGSAGTSVKAAAITARSWRNRSIRDGPTIWLAVQSRWRTTGRTRRQVSEDTRRVHEQSVIEPNMIELPELEQNQEYLLRSGTTCEFGTLNDRRARPQRRRLRRHRTVPPLVRSAAVIDTAARCADVAETQHPLERRGAD